MCPLPANMPVFPQPPCHTQPAERCTGKLKTICQNWLATFYTQLWGRQYSTVTAANSSNKWQNTGQVQTHKYYSPTRTNALIQMITFPSCITNYDNANIKYPRPIWQTLCGSILFKLKLKDFRLTRFLILLTWCSCRLGLSPQNVTQNTNETLSHTQGCWYGRADYDKRCPPPHTLMQVRLGRSDPAQHSLPASCVPGGLTPG